MSTTRNANVLSFYTVQLIKNQRIRHNSPQLSTAIDDFMIDQPVLAKQWSFSK